MNRYSSAAGEAGHYSATQRYANRATSRSRSKSVKPKLKYDSESEPNWEMFYGFEHEKKTTQTHIKSMLFDDFPYDFLSCADSAILST
jgi:hypothetical protein